MEGAFGGDEPDIIRKAYEEAPEDDDDIEEVDEPEEPEASSSSYKGTKRKQSAASSAKRKITRTEACSLENSEVYYPTVKDEGNHLHAAVDPQYISSRKSSHHTTTAGYSCLFSVVAKSQGKVVLDCEKISTTKGQLSTHIRKDHLRISVGCYVCCTVPKYRAAVDYTPRLRAPRNLPRCTANSNTYRQ